MVSRRDLRILRGGNTRIIFLGPPGAGKGTYSTRLASFLGIPHISTGDIFRDAIKQNSALGKQVVEYVQQGQLVPDAITIDVLKSRIGEPDCQQGFILDGYPRTIPQAEALDAVAKIEVVLNLRIHEAILIAKLAARRVCEDCGEIYNIIDIHETLDDVEYDMPGMRPQTPGRCDVCGGTLMQRKDDQVEVIETRLKQYHQQSEPLIHYYHRQGLIEDIYVHLGIDQTIAQILNKLKPHLL